MQTPIARLLQVCFVFPLGSILLAQGQSEPKSTAPVVMSMSAPSADTPLGAAWQRFLAGQPGATWWSHWSPATGTPKEIYGSGLPLAGWRGDTIEEARRHAEQLLHDQAELLALGTSEFREVIGARMGQTWCFVYDQFYQGLPVIDGRADVRVHGVGRIPMFGSTAWQIPANFNVIPRLGELEATTIAWQAVGTDVAQNKQPAPVDPPRLVIWGDVLSPTLAPVSLCWEVSISNVDANGDGPIGRYYVDAVTGHVLHFTSDKHEDEHGGGGAADHGAAPGGDAGAPTVAPPILTATGTVMAWTRTGLAGNSALVNVPVPNMAVVTGQGTVYTDANGNYSINLNIFIPSTTASFSLDGIHNQAIVGPNSPVFSTTIFAGNNGVAQLQAPTDLEAAHTTTYYWVHTVNEFSRSILGNTAQLNTADNVTPTVNIANTCNAWYNNNTINFYHAGGSCRNTAFSTVIAHEWGHGLDDRYGGISNNSGDGLSEGWGDIIAMYLVDNPIVGDNFYTSGGYIRNGNNSRVYPPPSEVHDAGEVWMGFAWMLRDRLALRYGRSSAISITNNDVIGSIVADATDQLGAYLQVYIADDNDGNLANLTPHATEIAWAGGQKHYPYPLSGPPSNDECTGAYDVYNGTAGTFNNDLALNSSPSWTCSLYGSKDLWFRYLAGNGPLTVDTCGATWDTEIEVFSGSCGALTSIGCNDDFCGLQSSVTVNITTPGFYYIRVGGYNNHSGPFDLHINGTAGNYAYSYDYGVGCYNVSRAFYELSTAAAFDLNLSGMQLTRNVSVYNVSSGGTYHVPGAGATALALTDDSEVTVPLTGTFNFPGGSTTALTVCSNGFVSAATGNGTGFSPSGASWVNSAQARWGTWHDFNPGASGSGAVKFEQVGSIAYVTWDGVYDFSTTNRNTWQLQFNLSNGTVTFVWPTMSGTGNSVLVGYSPAGTNANQGSLDLSAAMPFQTNLANTFALALTSTTPTIGTTSVMTTTNYPANSTLGALVEGFVQVNPGTSLAGAGMPGCLAYVGSPNVTILMFPVGGQSTYNQAIPNAPDLMGLQIVGQSYAFAPGANPTGVIASNGTALVIGF